MPGEVTQVPSVVRRYWYLLHVGECPVCARDQSYRERVYGPKPVDPGQRVRHLPLHACPEHFA